MSDVYSFGVVLLELLTGRKSVDKSRPQREQNLVEWARPLLNDSRKLNRIMDPRLECQYSETGAQKAAALAYRCLSHRPKQRPVMSTVVKTLEPLKDFDDLSVGPFVYTVPTESKEDLDENERRKELKKENGHHHHHHHHQLHHGHNHRTSPKSPKHYHYNVDKPKKGLNSPMHHRSKGV